jgi:hypothetical protein
MHIILEFQNLAAVSPFRSRDAVASVLEFYVGSMDRAVAEVEQLVDALRHLCEGVGGLHGYCCSHGRVDTCFDKMALLVMEMRWLADQQKAWVRKEMGA